MKKLFYFSNLLIVIFCFCSGIASAATPVITGNPSNDTVCAGSNAWFAVMSSDSMATFIWEKSTNGGTTWDTVTGVTGDTLRIAAVTAGMSGNLYRAFAVDTTVSAASTTAMLYVRSAPVASTITGTSSVCVGSTLNLAATDTGGVWTSAMPATAVVSAGVVTGVMPGMDTIWYTTTNTCGSAMAYKVITVLGVNAGTILGAANVCIGSTVAFTDSITGGAWMSTDSTIISLSSTGMVTGLAAGSAHVYYVVNSTCGADTARFSLTVGTISVGAITGHTNLCAGSTDTLSDTSAGGTWNTSNAAIATIDGSGILHGISAGVVTVSYMVTVSCGLTTVTTSDTVRTIGIGNIVGSISNLCIGASTTLTDSTAGGHWYSSDTLFATVTDSGVVRGIARGYDTIIYSVNTACGIVNTWYPMTINFIPTGTVSSSTPYVCHGTTLSMNETITGGTWSVSDTTVATISATGVINAMTSGIDSVYYTVTNSCGTAHSWAWIMVDSTVAPAPITGPSNVCIGGTITFANANPSSRGMWSVSNSNATVSATGAVRGSAYGIDTVTFVYTNSCNSVSSWKTAIIDTAISSGSISTSSNHICSGSWTRFHASNVGGMWLSSDYSVATPDTAGFVTGRGQGTAIISYTYFDACGAFVATDTLWVYTPAAMLTGNDSVGVGNMITLTDSSVGGTWGGTDTTIARVMGATGVVTGISAGSTMITYSLTNVCGTSTATERIYVGVAPVPPAIVGADTVCPGVLTAFSDASVGVWSISNTGARIFDTGTVIGDSLYKYDTIMFTTHNAFGSTTISKPIFVNGPPVIHTSIPVGISLTLSYTFVDTPSYGTWMSTDPSKVNFISANTFVPIRPGITDLIYTCTNACGTSRDTFVVNIAGGGSSAVTNVAENVAFLNVYPNPNPGNFSVNLISADAEEVKIIVTNLVGETVREIKTTTNTINNVVLNQPAGIYLLEAKTKSSKYSTRITVTE